MGVDNKTLDGFSHSDVSNIIQKLKDHYFAFKPVKRVYLETPNGKKRSIGICHLKVHLGLYDGPRIY